MNSDNLKGAAKEKQGKLTDDRGFESEGKDWRRIR